MNSSSFSVHVDCDNSWIYEEELGVKPLVDRNYLYNIALKRLLELFNNHKVHATFFIVGRDLSELKACEEFCKLAMSYGHKIGNHSFNHPMNFGTLNSAERIIEIQKCHDVIMEKLSYKCEAFRSPGYGVKDSDLQYLAENGYKYDSSVLPGFATLIIKLRTLHIKNYRKKTLCVNKNLFATTKPVKYLYGENLRLWRIPISSFPLFRLPVHTSFLFTLGQIYSQLAIISLRFTKSPKIILFHGLDLCEQISSDAKSIVPAFNISYRKRFDICNKLLAALSNETVHIEDILD